MIPDRGSGPDGLCEQTFKQPMNGRRCDTSARLPKKPKKRYMKTKRDILGLVCVLSIFAACIITNEEGDPCLVNYILFGVALISGILSKPANHEGRR